MKTITKRTFSLLLALAMVLGMLVPAVTLDAHAETVDYRYAGSYIYNWGNRGETATFLSQNAEAFYEDNNTSYAELSQLAGSSNTGNVPSSPLYKALKKLMEDNHSNITSYNATRSLYKYTDVQNSGLTTSKISSFYSGKLIGPEWDGGTTWNREHTWPNSKGLDGQDENDIMMLRPTSMQENSGRGNKAYGEGGSFYNPNSESGGTYDLRGDVSRIMLYQYVRWGNTSKMWGADGVMESKAILLKWLEEDPVDTWELGRNDSVEAITGTRNVFVDYPELAFELFDADIPANYPTPGGGTATAYTITALSNNSTYGTVTLSGNVITALPKTGYAAVGYEVTAGTATVSRVGNNFTVNASSDCTVTVNFEARTAATVSFSENGTVIAVKASYSGDEITMPELQSQTPADHTFLGWVAEKVTDASEKPGTVYAVGSDYPVAGDVTLYALYSITTGGGGSTEYVKTDITAIQSTHQVVITMTNATATYALSSVNGSSSAPPASNSTRVTVSDDKLTAEPAEEQRWTVEAVTGGYVFHPNGDTNKWLYSTTSNNGIRVGTGSNKTFVVDNEYNYLKQTDTGRYVGVYNNSDFRSYTSMHSNISGQTLAFYVKTASGGSTTYTTEVDPCLHENAQTVVAAEPSCEGEGNTAGMYCPDCQIYYGGYEVIDPLGHGWAEGDTVPPTAEDQGYTIYECQRCDAIMHDDFVEATGVQYTLKFVVPAGVTAIADREVDGEDGTTLPVPVGTPAGSYTYTFLGWSATDVADTTVAPAVLEGNTFYLPEENTTLYAVYSYAVGGTGGSSDYTLVTDASALVLDSELVIVGENDGNYYALSTNQKTSNRGATQVTVTGDVVTWDATDVQIITLEAGAVGGTYAFYVEGDSTGHLYAASSSSNQLKTGTKNENASWQITVEEGLATMLAQGSNSRNKFRFNYNGGAPLFSCYGSTATTGVNVALYQKTGTTGTVHYSSLTCAHADTENRVATPAGCESNGVAAGVFCNDCGVYISGGETLLATGHDMVAGAVTPPTAEEQGYTTYTCANGCGRTEQRNFTEATGYNYTVQFVVPDGITEQPDMVINSKTGAALPSAAAPSEYTFYGWATAPVEETEDAPDIITGTYTPTGNITLYAVYQSAGSGGSGGSNYVKVTATPGDWSGDYLIVYEAGSVAFNGGLGTLDVTNNYIEVTIDDGTISSNATTDAAKFTIAEYDDGYSIQSASGKYIGRSGASNGLSTATSVSTNYKNTLTLNADKTVAIAGTGGLKLQFNSASNQLRFRYFTSTQKPIALYKLTEAAGGGSSTYTSFDVAVVAPIPEIALENVAVEFGNSLSLHFSGYASKLDQYDDVYVEFSAEGKQTKQVSQYFVSGTGANTSYNFGFDGLTILDMNLTVYATVHGTRNGEPFVGETRSYSLLNYCTYAILNDTGDAVPAANMLKYAIAAEAFKNVPAEDRVENIMSAEALTAMETYAYADSAVNVQSNFALSNGAQVKFVGQNVDMTARLTMIYMISTADYTGELSDLTFTISYTDIDGEPATKNYTSANLVSAGDGVYALQFAEFYSVQMRDEATCTIYVDGVEHASYQNSVEHYCHTTINNTSETEAMKYLAKRISLYGDACADTYPS